MNPSKTKAVDLLFRAQVLSRPQYDRAMSLMQSSRERAEDVLIDNDIITEAELLKALAAIYRTNFVSAEKLAKADIPKATVQLIPKRVAETLGVFPVLFDRTTSVLSVVTPDPDNVEMLREVKLVSGTKDVRAFVTRPAALQAAIRKHHGGDARAFERFERVSALDFGQQVLPDGRVTGAKDAYSRDDELTFDRLSPPPAPRRSPPPPDEDEFMRPPARANTVVNRPSFNGSSPPPVPKRQTLRGGERGSDFLSAPPPPPSRKPPPAPAPQQTRARAPSIDSFDSDLPPPPPQPSRSRQQQPPPKTPSFDSDLPPAQEPSFIGKSPSVTPAAYLSGPPSAQLQNDTTIELLTVMVSLLENARQELRGHSSQVARLLRRVAERMRLSGSDTYAVIVAGHIHDLGKMGQFHLTALNCSEYEGHKTAAQKAYETPLRLLEAVRLPVAVRNAVFHMYERFDGNGFPDKLVGKDIPLGARLLAVADTYADLTQNPRNPFRKVLAPAEAMNVLAKHKGAIFDPAILDLFNALVLGEDMKAKLLANRHRALIIDSDPEESTVLELRMVEQGFDVKIARNADAARKLFATEGVEFDLVVSELELPDTDGLAFLSEARKERWGRELAWVFHTAKQGRAEAQRAFELGALDYVAKPVQADVLVAKIKAMLEQRSQSGKGGAAKGVSGSLREMGLPDIVQVLFHGRKTGKLNVKNDSGKSGEIHFLEGAVANAVLGNLKGADAFYAMVRFTDGEFALDPSFVPTQRVVAESAEALLLEGMRRMDEGI